MSNSRVNGKCRWFDKDKGYGFIEMDSGEDVFVYADDIKLMGNKILCEGDEVAFEPYVSKKGYRAKNVNVIKRAHGLTDQLNMVVEEDD